jgi:hypothetical protein
VPAVDADATEPVKFRAFRGTRRASVYREHAVSERVFLRIIAVGGERALPLLSSLSPDSPHVLDKTRSQQLGDELGHIRRGGELPDLDRDLTAIAEVARWCARARGSAWMRIEPP